MAEKKILVVDDEPDFLRMIKIRLEANNYKVITASDGKKAIESVKRDKPDAVLLDIVMPGMDGFRTLKEIRKINRNLPVFIITAFSTQERFSLANKLSASGFIVKTSNLKQEVNNITNILNIAPNYKNLK
jgi:DNA-binding response OmpR family regulator